MDNRFAREALLIGEQGVDVLEKSRVLVFGVGGVGAYAVEALARSGVGFLTLVDGDIVSITNINRQLLALESTLGRPKVEVARERILEINPRAQVEARKLFVTEENIGDLDFSGYSYVVDAIDTVSAKLAIIQAAESAGVPVITCMGAGNKFDPSAFRVEKIEKTSVCPLARVMRRELKKRGITGVKAVYSQEEAAIPVQDGGEKKGTAGRPAPGSMAFVPGAAGLVLAGAVIADLLGN